MRRPSRSEIPMGQCPHPGCDAPIRLVANYRANTVKIYHGEDELAELAPVAGHSWASMIEDMTPGTEGYDRLVSGIVVGLAFGIAEMHRQGAA